ncbi:MAG: hypothetical protein R3E39_28130 [Anaerolineae bacterium]
MDVPILLRVAAFLHWFVAIGFGVFCIPAIRNLLAGRDIPMVMGFPAYGRGPFERAGIPTTVPLLAGFLVVCILEGVAGYLLWQGSMSGAVLALVLLPVGAIFWWGFALPIPPICAVIWTVLILVSWQALH